MSTNPGAAWVLPVCLCVMFVFVVVVASLDIRDEHRAHARYVRRCQEHPLPPPPRSVAYQCHSCNGLVRYEIHPQGRADAVALHNAYECTSTLSRKEVS